MTSATPRPFTNAFFQYFPVELVREIVVLLEVKDILSLCLVCKDFHSVCIDILYKNIHTNKTQCFNTLASNVQNAKAVRNLTLPAQINIELDVVCNWLRENSSSSEALLFNKSTADVRAASVLPLLSNLRNLSVPPFSAIYTQALPECHFPLLRVFSYAMPITQPLVSFLSRTIAIVRLSLDSYIPFRSDLKFNELSIALPHLQHLTGNPQVVKLFAEHAPLATVHINWNFDRRNMQALEQALDSLASHCSSTLKEFAVYRNLFRQTGCNLQILSVICDKLPHITTLGLNGVQLDANLSATQNALSRFTYLEYLDMDHHPFGAVRPPRSRSFVVNWDQDEVTILSWASACPTLKRSRLHSTSFPSFYRNTFWLKDPRDGILWRFYRPDVWIPLLSTVPQRRTFLTSMHNWCSRRIDPSIKSTAPLAPVSVPDI
ncbi:hypothetical protein GYMLUDRAFT_837992 [Collybiopsis luxurians FD-317 M1]|uniref:F-box domain-containing protein n=1 Tax=Collybiopsis luxurians FD-317 M1 TaxID=944289 RepID=A0A0D0CBW2_9AGAR|nr:hypothetical protein GYMLUDRAFT_837992 [Collybiopsis luxurians FD-317 M1]